MERMRQELAAQGIRTQVDCPLSKHSTFRIGGKAELGVFPQSEAELVSVLQYVCDSALPYLVIGKGSNVVFSDSGFAGAVLFTEGVKGISVEGREIRAAAGETLTALSQTARDASLSGLVFAYGIPGTVGGAVFMNAGAFGGEMSDVCVKTAYFDTKTGKCGELTGQAHAFGYRTSFYEQNPHLVILSATCSLHAGEREEIGAQMEAYAEQRRTKQPLQYPSAGSTFKRPVGHFAGKLIEDCGLKGVSVGGAQVSEKHAGFLINRGGATAADVRELTELIQSRVFERFGVRLECEIRFL